MGRGRLPGVLLATAGLLAALGGCDSVTYKNPGHPEYGDTQYKTDLAQ